MMLCFGCVVKALCTVVLSDTLFHGVGDKSTASYFMSKLFRHCLNLATSSAWDSVQTQRPTHRLG